MTVRELVRELMAVQSPDADVCDIRGVPIKAVRPDRQGRKVTLHTQTAEHMRSRAVVDAY